MQKTIIFLIYITIIKSTIFSQNYTDEFGIMGGGSYYIGDLNPYNHFDRYDYNLGGVFRRTLKNKQIVLRFHAKYGKISAEDKQTDLSFRSSILEIGPVVEINFIPFEIGEINKYIGTPYLFGGITYFKMDPQTQRNGDWVSLQTLGTEGQGSSLNSDKQYNSRQISLPVGFGLKVNLSKRFALSLEYGIRKTYTDYLDDVSGTYVNLNQLEVENGKLAAELSKSYDITGLQRGYSKNKDWYSIYGIMLSFRMLPKNECKNNFIKR